MPTTPKKAVTIGILLALCGSYLMTSTTPVYAAPVGSAQASKPGGRQRYDQLANLAGVVTGGALASSSSIAAALCSSAAAGAVGGAVGLAVAVGLNAAYNASTAAYNAATSAYSYYTGSAWAMQRAQGDALNQDGRTQIPPGAPPSKLLD